MTVAVKVAVLDDYQGKAESIFKKLAADTFDVTVFKDTLLPYNHPDTPQDAKDKLVQRLESFNVICTMRERTPFPGALIARLPNLKFLLTTGPRNAGLDLSAFKQHGIPVVGVHEKSHSSVGPDSTTQHCVALNLALARNVAADDAAVKAGGWQTAYATGLAGKVFATVGLGRLGVSVAKIMRVAFDMKVVAWSPNLTQEAADEKTRAVGFPVEGGDGEKTFKVVSKEELFRTADLVNIHVVLSDRSRGLITGKELQLMKPTALFVNTSRGPIVVEKDLVDILDNGKIQGAALDVFEIEPLPLDSPWRTIRWGEDGRSQVVLSPHMGYVERDTMEKWYVMQVESIQQWHRGQDLAMRLI